MMTLKTCCPPRKSAMPSEATDQGVAALQNGRQKRSEGRWQDGGEPTAAISVRNASAAVLASEKAALRFFTICARNFLPGARVLYDSVKAVHPDATFTVYLCDRDTGYDPDQVGMNIQPLESLGIPALEQMIRTYNITELCTAIKPYCFLREFALHVEEATGPAPHIVYTDPDIELFSPLEEVQEALDAGAQCVLTPHILEPAERAEKHDQHYLKYGVYNLGFVAMRNTPAVREVMRWWGRRMVSQCVIDVANGLFVDQKWVDLVPAFLDDIKILRHPGYNIAYWNLHERRIDLTGEALRCNGKPLRFVHYSGIILEDTERLSRHSRMFHISNSFGYGSLVAEYRKKINTPFNKSLRKLNYAFLWNGKAKTNVHTREALPVNSAFRSPDKLLVSRQFFWLDQFTSHMKAEAAEIAQHRKVERNLIPPKLDPDGGFRFQGYCYTCDSQEQMVSSLMYSTSNYANGDPIPNWREHVACSKCGLTNRVRASIHLFLQEFLPAIDSPIYITEQKTMLYDWLALRFGALQGSEYFGGHYKPGEMVDGIRNENFEKLSFGSEEFEYLLSFDVLEHVACPENAFSEACRVLRPGGYLIFSVPAHLHKYANTIRAQLEPDGSITHFMEPEYHGNPVDHEGGALCFRYYGWEIMDMLRAAGFRRPFVLHYWSRQFGYLGKDQVLFVAQKPG